MVRRSGKKSFLTSFEMPKQLFNPEILLIIDYFWQRKQSLSPFTSRFFVQPFRKLECGAFWNSQVN